ncbi:holocytochrome c synthase [Coemansia spiralis]|uniref:Holocytochrome c-type synthase n=2 Tax=Coemansia TaxID=4863 RepID=A0A9W8KWP3_9FUNG|nr:cytochrome c/c1 heme-lyase [Coemansia spiralis]KAJ1991199.1 holocytochrome c synthase [Coemansia umbellata]KAJ2621168.1 holocytochrome c synthase [Coemansia sp. RSA 1358]KAJ2673088.1 holocytochrome c synthase [Coemansia spiralis]
MAGTPNQDSGSGNNIQGGGGCPVDHSAIHKYQHSSATSSSDAPHGSSCPIDHGEKGPSFAQSLFGSPPPNKSACPVNHGSASAAEERPSSSFINPLNMMPNLTQDRHEGQQTALSTDRELSSIPRANSESSNDNVWEYPSPQQFYNALARKNMAAPEEYMDIMVDIHNFLNEGAWNEVLKWEARHKTECLMPRLMRLQGRPRDLSPMARMSSWIHGVRPFDRHDWYVDRCGKQVRYVIDYYEGVPENDMPVFNLVVRPAIDNFSSLTDRAKQLWADAKGKYFGSEKK